MPQSATAATTAQASRRRQPTRGLEFEGLDEESVMAWGVDVSSRDRRVPVRRGACGAVDVVALHDRPLEAHTAHPQQGPRQGHRVGDVPWGKAPKHGMEGSHESGIGNRTGIAVMGARMGRWHRGGQEVGREHLRGALEEAGGHGEGREAGMGR